MILSPAMLAQQLAASECEKLTETELLLCAQAVETIEPPCAKQFWRSLDASAGIYIVVAGKVRLLDESDNLIATLGAGSSFGQATLFREDNFGQYTARASTNLKLCYLKQDVLQPLMDKHPQIRTHLYQQAELWDLLLICRHKIQSSPPSDVQAMHKALSLFKRQKIDISDNVSLPADVKALLLYKGELQNYNNHSLTPGKIYVNPNKSNWHTNKPTIVYILRDSDWLACLAYWSKLALIDDGSTSVEPISPPNRSNVIPFRQPQPAPKPKSKKRLAYFPSPKQKVGHWWQKLSKQYPFYAQHSASDCGAACLVMIGLYWGKQFSLNRLRDLANTNRSGVDLRSLAAAAESIGFASRPVKATFAKLAEQSLPAIAHWEGKHYIVVNEITNKQVIVSDPAIGIRKLTKNEFIAGWSGYALLLQPTSELKETEEAATGFWQFFDIIKPHWKVLLEVFVASVLLQIFGLVTPLFTQLLFDRVIVQGSTATLNAIGLGLLVFGLFRLTMSGVRQYLLAHTANRVGIALLVGFMKHTFRLPLAFFETRYVGDIVSRIQENQKIQRFLTGETLGIVLDFMTVFIYLGLMFWYNWRLTLLVLVIVPPYFILAFTVTPLLRRISREIFNASAEENSYLIEALTGIRSIRSMAVEQTVRWHWEEQLYKLVKKGFSGQVINIRLSLISGTIDLFSNTALLWFGAWLVINQQLTIGQLVAFNMLIGNVLGPFQRLAGLWNQLQEIVISTERINDVIQAEPEEDLQNKPRQSLRKLQGRIRFENVTFRYHSQNDTNVLQNLSFEIQPEQTVAVVGRSGSGKTTLSKLILGLYLPTEGKVLIDGLDVTTISLRSLRSQFGVVSQDTFLFGGTVRENISIAYPQASIEEIIDAARLAGADEFIQKLPLGYETQIGEGGGMLSGGQRQRLAIARALLGNPRFILLDEATSHLDSESERIIQNNLKTILKGRTSLIIAHRLSTIRNADLILVLDRGVLVESGTHDELIAKKGHYFYLNQQQLAHAG